MKKDFLDEIIADRSRDNPDFPRLVEEATARRGLGRLASGRLPHSGRRGTVESMPPDDPIAKVREYLARHDPDVLAAVADVDRSLIQAMLELHPFERLERALQLGQTLMALAAKRQPAT